MSISDKINSIRTHLEDDYTALEQLGVSVEDRNIENIKDMANQIYAKFPKTDYAEGSNITLSNTLKGKLDFEDGIVGYGDTSQEGTPTPDNPQDIEVVRGKNRLLNNTIEVVERGKNCFDTSLLPITQSGVTISKNENGDIVLNGTPSISSGHISFHVSDRTTLKAGTFTASVENKVTGIGIAFNGVASYNITMVDTITRKTNTTSQDFTGEYLVNVSYDVGTLTNYVLNPQLEEGSTATTYEPYQTPQTYQLSLGEYEFAKIGNYVDTIEYDVDEDKVYKNEKIGKYTFTGNETIVYQSVNNRFAINNLINNLDVQARQQVYSNRYEFIGSGSADYGMFTYWDTAVHQVFIYHKDYTSPSDLLTYYANNNTYFYYIRNNLNKIEITGTLKDQIKALYYSHSFTGTTIIEINGQLPLIIKVRALKGE